MSLVSTTPPATISSSIIPLGDSFSLMVPIDSAINTINKIIKKEIKRERPNYEMMAKEDLRARVPVRSGRLLDTLLKTLVVEIIGDNIVFNTSPPVGYPPLIKNPAHRGEVGWGRKYKPIQTIANRHVIRETSKGAYYLLNDPSAISDYMSILGTQTIPRVKIRINRVIPSFDMIVILPKEPHRDIDDFIGVTKLSTGGYIAQIIDASPEEVGMGDYIPEPIFFTPDGMISHEAGYMYDDLMEADVMRKEWHELRFPNVINVEIIKKKSVVTQMLYEEGDTGIQIGLGLPRTRSD